MAIMNTCCCWRSVRRGSFACAIYTGIYFGLVATSMSMLLEDEHLYLSGNTTMPKSVSFLEPEGLSPVTLKYNMILLICSCCGVICCILLVYGLLRDQKYFLLPWIVSVITSIFVDISHTLYLCIFTSVYSLLCVISQYQEYNSGRGTASDDCEHRIPVIRYTVQPTTTATSCLSSRRPCTTIDHNETNELKTNINTNIPTQSSTSYRTILSFEKNTSGEKAVKKHVQFPDTPSSSQTCKSGMYPIILPRKINNSII
ncbi:hypothetical protein HCN44_001173 [Aphidius gifuensis]|uniref:Uncharacterized protein n=1 Tax=Aphidius gifuensis TaxID=684658 RepID=A0A834XNS5_APHGI|nr:hypothetical protein HCN44_001173 [Aphidius gifuensis]